MDDILYSLFVIVITIVMFFANGKKAKEDNSRVPNPNQREGDNDREQSDKWFNSDDTCDPEQSLADIIEAFTGLKHMPAPPPVPKQKVRPAPVHSMTSKPIIQEARAEGQRVTRINASDLTENPYNAEIGDLSDLSAQKIDWRKAIIAHEILKRKF